MDEEDYGLLKDFINKMGIKEFTSIFDRRIGHVTIHEDQEKAFLILEKLNSLSIPSLNWSIIRIENYYTPKEFQSFPIYHIMAESFVEVPENRIKEIYDYSQACNNCGWGRKQINDLIIKDIKKIDKIHFTKTYDFEYIASRGLGDYIVDSGFTGISLRDVHSRTKKYIGYQLEPTHILSPIRTDLLEHPKSWNCESCGIQGLNIGGLFSGQDEYIIIENRMNHMDFNYTKEKFGSGQNAHQEIVISSEVVKAFKEFKVKRISLQPVHIIDHYGKKLTPDFKPKPSKVNIMDYKSHFYESLKRDLFD